jgi:adenylate kinase
MAPIGDDTVKSLQDLVNKLETRVKELEDKLGHAAAGTKHTTPEGVRMILMGPPGAGKQSFFLTTSPSTG